MRSTTARIIMVVSANHKSRHDLNKLHCCTNGSSTNHHISACAIYNQIMKAIGFCLEDEDASDNDHENFMRGIISNFVPAAFKS